MTTEKDRHLGAGANVGAVAIEQEGAIAEAQGQLILAKRVPRDETAAHAKLMSSCKLPGLASVAFYNVPRAGGSVSGPSIRLAEEIARVYGNFEYGHKELSRTEGKSEVLVYAWDKENNNYSTRQITVMHVLDYKDKQTRQPMQRPLHDQKDIDDKIANVASKQMRGRILALLPKWMVEDAIQQCRQTLAGNVQEPIESRVRKMSQAFAVFGVTVDMLQNYIGHPLASVTADELVDLIGIHNAIRDGGIKASEFFGGGDEPEPKAQPASIAKLNAAVAANENKPAAAVKQTKKAAVTVAAEPAVTTEPAAADPVVTAAAAPEEMPPMDEDDPFGGL
jgi:hypothetical protein